MITTSVSLLLLATLFCGVERGTMIAFAAVEPLRACPLVGSQLRVFSSRSREAATAL
jgi:hypothetical protein